MRFEQLEYLATVVRVGSVRRAAEALHISQSALSETLRNLETELGVTLLERRRTGASLTPEGRELLPLVADVLDSVDRLGQAVDDQHRTNRSVRIGTVNAATSPILAPALREFSLSHPGTQVTVTPAQQAEIRRQLLEGGIDLGLTNLLANDDLAPEVEATLLLRGRVVACIQPDDPLASLQRIRTADLEGRTLILMRSGYAMHRFAHRWFGGRLPTVGCSMDGAEMGKVMVAEGLGVTLLPDYSVIGDPLERCGAIVARPLEADDQEVRLYLERRRSRHTSRGLDGLVLELRNQARRYEAVHAAKMPTSASSGVATPASAPSL